ncbi:hypothetical protein Pan189_22030 [Stratiformator vulcanicus]|uniref:Uncharacterized protein n=1 Tax=Stratiformator vulcanicus TaxID=2527980 RepID=A0A517R1T9_9PLAN|nr:hypothetical protein Pan189_22030 [Stratiformator vulcanicus]
MMSERWRAEPHIDSGAVVSIEIQSFAELSSRYLSYSMSASAKVRDSRSENYVTEARAVAKQ